MNNSLIDRINEIMNAKNSELFPPFPKKNMLIEITNSCNCNCIFCANSKMKRKRKKIDKQLLIKILNQAYELGTREVGFYTTGEPLLNDSLEEYTKIAKEIGYTYVYITTNGILLNKIRAKDIIKSGIDSIKISINGINKDDYLFIHGIDKYEVVMNNLKELNNLRKELNAKFKIYVSYISTRYTDYDTITIKEHFKKYCDEIMIVNVRNQSGMMPEVNKKLSCTVTDNKIQAERMVPCHYVFDTVNVTCEGYLTACCADFENYLAYADLNKVSLKEAWHNTIITNLRSKHLNKKLSNTLCNNCINCSCKTPKPINKEYIEKEITKDVFKDNTVNERINKRKG